MPCNEPWMWRERWILQKSFEGWKLHDDVCKVLGRAHCHYNFRKAMNEGLKEFGLGILYSLPDLGI